MTERLVINRLGHLGDGIADTASGQIYVRYTLPGETVGVEAWPDHPDRRHLLEIIEASAERIAPICPHFTVCGGCAMQHWTEARYRAWKRELVVAAFAQAGIEAEVGALVDAHGAGRRRATFHARMSGHDVLSVGFAAAAAHHIIPIDHCPVLSPALTGALPVAWAIAQALSPLKKPLDIQTTATDGGIDVDVRGSGPISTKLAARCCSVAEQHRLSRITRHGEFVTRRTSPLIAMGRATVELPPGAFLQATEEGEAALAREVIGHLAGAKTAIDLFCGVGPFALRIAEFARVSAADSDEPAVAALTKASGASGPQADYRNTARSLSATAGMAGTQSRRHRVRPAASRCGSAGAGNRQEQSQNGCRRIVQSDDARTRCENSPRRRLPARRGHAVRSVSLFGSRRNGGEVHALEAAN